MEGRRIQNKKSHFFKTYNVFLYNLAKLERDDFENRNFISLEKDVRRLVKDVNDSVSLVFSDDKELSQDDENKLSTTQMAIMKTMVNCFSAKILSFEDCSEDYKNKRNMCIFLVSLCFFVIFIKAFMQVV